jgi:hypothetical protein
MLSGKKIAKTPFTEAFNWILRGDFRFCFIYSFVVFLIFFLSLFLAVCVVILFGF